MAKFLIITTATIPQCIMSSVTTHIHSVRGVTHNCLTHLSPYLMLILIHMNHVVVPAIKSHSLVTALCRVFVLLTEQNTYLLNSSPMLLKFMSGVCMWLPLIQTRQAGCNITVIHSDAGSKMKKSSNTYWRTPRYWQCVTCLDNGALSCYLDGHNRAKWKTKKSDFVWIHFRTGL